jgi:FixJ family two-component response regulator
VPVSEAPTVFIVDDDDAVRDSLRLLVKSLKVRAETFSSAVQFLDKYDPKRPGCLVLDIRMPGMSGLELQKRLHEAGATIPIIFITGHGDVPMAVHAMQAGAIDFIQKPFRDQDLIDRIQQAVAQDGRMRATLADRSAIRQRLTSLTPREDQVMRMVVEGKANKVVAFDLGLSERTVEIHRSRVMSKMHADSLAQLVQMVMRANEPEE